MIPLQTTIAIFTIFTWNPPLFLTWSFLEEPDEPEAVSE
jgi:hypothetical protein